MRLWWWTKFSFDWVRTKLSRQQLNNVRKVRPQGWEKCPLCGFFEMMWNNQIATFAMLGNSRRIRDIDALLQQFATNLSRVPNKGAVSSGLPVLLALRAHAAFRSAASLAFASAVMEAMAVLRLCLETAGYASMIKGNERLALIWTHRGDSEETKRAARQAFRHSDVLSDLRSKSGEIAGYYDGIYESLIESGAHPNEFGFMTNMQIERLNDGGAVLTQVYLQDDDRYLEMVLKATGQVGVCVLKIFERMYPKEFAELGISSRIGLVADGI